MYKMELAYLPDSMSGYNTWKIYPSWQESNFEVNISKKHHYWKPREVKKTDEKNCEICRQKKKRSLSDYIRSKQMDCQNSTSIREEEEEEDNNGDHKSGGM